MSPKFESPTDVAPYGESGAALGERLPAFIAGPSDAAKLLAGKCVAVVSAGSVASRVAAHLARLQVKSLLIIDPASFKSQSVLTHEILPCNIGQPKASWLADHCRQISPATRVSAHVNRVQEVPLSALADFDLVLLASDNLRCETYVGQLCQRLRIPLVQASVHGPSLTAQVRFFANTGPLSPCPACLFNSQEWELHDEEIVFSCDGGAPRERGAEPTMSTSFLCAIAADLAMTQFTRSLLGLGKPVADTLLSWNGYTHQTLLTPLRYNARCRAEHVTWEQAEAPDVVSRCTLDELLAVAGMQSRSLPESRVSVVIEGHVLIERAYCGCACQQPIGRLLPKDVEQVGNCSICRQPLVVPPYFRRDTIPLERLPRNVPLESLGASGVEGVLFDDATRVVFVRHSPSRSGEPFDNTG